MRGCARVWLPDTNSAYVVFLRDRVAGTTERVSVGTDGLQGKAAPCSDCYRPSLSDDGRFIALLDGSGALYAPPMVSDFNYGAAFTITVQAAAAQLSDLATLVKGVGPGASLDGKVHAAQSSVASGDSRGACSTLSAFINEVQARGCCTVVRNQCL